VQVASNGIRIHVKERGIDGLPLIFLHYWGGSARTWDHVTAILSASHRTFAIDLRGWGQSEAPPNGYGLNDLAADVEGVIDELDLRDYVLVGHSMGGKVAQLIASRQPHELAGLILVAPSPPPPRHMSAEAREMMAQAYSTREAIEATIDQVLTAKPLATTDREQVIEDSLRGAPQAKAAWPGTTSLEDISDKVPAIAAPTLVVAGELDRVDSVDLLKKELLSCVPHAVLQVLPRTGHLSMLESPRALAQIIATFVNSLPTATPRDVEP